MERIFPKSPKFGAFNLLRIEGSPTNAHHKNKYGIDFDYYKFRDTLALETKSWKADDLIEIIKNVGARYVVITSKHHDGFMMYPTTVANPFYEKNEITSSHDFVGELAEASRKKGLKFGVYCSGGLDWTFNQSPITNLWQQLDQNFLECKQDYAQTEDVLVVGVKC